MKVAITIIVPSTVNNGAHIETISEYNKQINIRQYQIRSFDPKLSC